MAIVDVVNSILQADSRPLLIGLVWRLAATWSCCTFINWRRWTLSKKRLCYHNSTTKIVLSLLLL